MATSDENGNEFDQAAQQVVELGNRLAEQDPEADLWHIGSGLLAGAIQYWLYARQPCGDPSCETCAEINTAERRMRVLLEEIQRVAESSEYYHAPTDANVGTA